MTSPARGATTRQAKALLLMGYRIPPVRIPPHKAEKYRRNTGRFSSKKGKRPTQRWIKENLTTGQAGLVLKQLKYESGMLDKSEEKKGKGGHEIVIPSRPFLGFTEEDTRQTTIQIAKEMIGKTKKR